VLLDEASADARLPPACGSCRTSVEFAVRSHALGPGHERNAIASAFEAATAAIETPGRLHAWGATRAWKSSIGVVRPRRVAVQGRK